MKLDKEAYGKYVKAHAKPSPILKNCILAFLVGGSISAIGEGLYKLYYNTMLMSEEDAGLLVSVSLIFAASLLTGIGVFDKIAKYAGAGTLVPITGFSNSVTSEALDAKSEGIIMGVGAKIFTVAGPVILFGISSGVLYGIYLFTVELVKNYI